MKKIKIISQLLLYLVSIFYLALYYTIHIFCLGFLDATYLMFQLGSAALMIFLMIITIDFIFRKDENSR